MALTISSCNTFHMPPELPCFHNYYLNPQIYTKLLSELLYSCTPVLLKKQLLKAPMFIGCPKRADGKSKKEGRRGMMPRRPVK